MHTPKLLPTDRCWRRDDKSGFFLLERLPAPTARGVIATTLIGHLGAFFVPGMWPPLLAMLGIALGPLFRKNGAVVALGSANALLVPLVCRFTDDGAERIARFDHVSLIPLSILVSLIVLQWVLGAIYVRSDRSFRWPIVWAPGLWIPRIGR